MCAKMLIKRFRFTNRYLDVSVFSMYPDADWFIRNISGGMEIDRFLLFQQGSLRITFLIAIIMVS